MTPTQVALERMLAPMRVPPVERNLPASPPPPPTPLLQVVPALRK